MNIHQINRVLSKYNISPELCDAILGDLVTLQSSTQIGTIVETPVSLVSSQGFSSSESSETLIFCEEKNSVNEEGTQPQVGRVGDYDDLGELGVGGMGEVRLVRDRKLNRCLAMKIIHAKMLNRKASAVRFIEEAQVCAQLQHPNIVPVHELGSLPDGRLYFTMKEIKGQSLDHIIQQVHNPMKKESGQAQDDWSFRRLISVFFKVCQAIAYAHSKGVLHRDLKPENIMLGEFGEVLVVDWGIAKVLGRADLASEDGEFDSVSTDRQNIGLYATQIGQVAGTPSYMSPEQARGEINALDAQSDVYSLGAILYEILTGRAPYRGVSMRDVLEQVRTGPPASIISSSGSATTLENSPVSITEQSIGVLPKALVSACETAMSRQKEDRYASVDVLAGEISDWLEGSKRREEALVILHESIALEERQVDLKKEAKELIKKGEEGLGAVLAWKGEDVKGPWWDIIREGKRKLIEAKRLSTLAKQKMQASLSHKPDLQEAHIALINRYKKGHMEAEEIQNIVKAEKFETRIHNHALALPAGSELRRQSLQYLKGTGGLSLKTSTDKVSVSLEKYVPYHQRLVVERVAELGLAPIKSYSIEMGSYRLVLKKAGYHDVIYPINIARGQYWDGVDPNGEERPVYLPKIGTIGADECYIPAGWFYCGGDPDVYKCFERKRIWVEDFVMAKYPVTNGQYLAFLNNLVDVGQTEKAELYSPKDNGTNNEIYGRDALGHFIMVGDSEGDIWGVDWPVMMVNFESAQAYCKWYAQRTKQNWMLPTEYMWEKAARGVDERWYPWGNNFDPSYACMLESHPTRPLPKPVYEFPIDTSVYGVRGMAGNVADWTLQPIDLSPKERFAEGLTVYRGGSWGSYSRYTRLAFRVSLEKTLTYGNLGFRICRLLSPD